MEKTLNKEELKALLDVFGGTTPERINWLVFHGITMDMDTEELWLKVPVGIEEALDPTIDRF